MQRMVFDRTTVEAGITQAETLDGRRVEDLHLTGENRIAGYIMGYVRCTYAEWHLSGNAVSGDSNDDLFQKPVDQSSVDIFD